MVTNPGYLKKSQINNRLFYQFGFEIPYLPDFLLENTIIGETTGDKLQSVFQRFQNFVIGLHKYTNSSYSLRFIYKPETGQTHIALLGSIMQTNTASEQLAFNAMQNLETHLASYNFPSKQLYLHNSQSIQGDFFDPFPLANLNIIEIRQYEKVMEFLAVDSTAYVVFPYQGAQGTLQETFELMVRLNMPVCISVTIQPTEISPHENKIMAQAAHLAQTYSEVSLPTISDTSVQTRRDPNAQLVGRLYDAYLNSLSNPFLAVVQILSPDFNTALVVAKSYASSVVMNQLGITDASQRPLPTDTALVIPKNTEEKNIALQSFSNLVIQPWGDTVATKETMRLKYLAGAKGISTIFRFPVNIGAGILGISVKQTPPEFYSGRRITKVSAGEIDLGEFQFGGKVTLPMQNLVRHAFVTGFTGSGKSNTMLFLLDQLWRKNKIPFMVIESAKKEYRVLGNDQTYKDLLIFTLGDETTSPFRFNPFELFPGVRLEAHLGRLQTCFDAALPQFGILPSLIAESLEIIYARFGWKLTDVASENEERLFPTMKDLLDTILSVIEKRGYKGEIYHNLLAAVSGRIGSLLRGSRGKMFCTQKSIPPQLLFSTPVILELNDLNQQDKSLTLMFLLMWLREYRELHTSKNLTHVTVIEEAHNVLSNSDTSINPEISADTKGKSVESFTNLLSEVRSYGEGIFIVDQSPAKISPDAIRNTNLQIAHQLRDENDRNAIARAMIMDENQQKYLAKLGVGKAALFCTGLEKATFVTIPDAASTINLGASIPNDEAVKLFMQPYQKKINSILIPFNGCKFCSAKCDYREITEPLTVIKQNREKLLNAMAKFNQQPQPEFWDSHWHEIASICSNITQKSTSQTSLDAAFCFFVQLVDLPFNAHMRESFALAYNNLK